MEVMPELPEVETVRRGLAPHIEGKRVVDFTLHRADLRFPFPKGFKKRMVMSPLSSTYPMITSPEYRSHGRSGGKVLRVFQSLANDREQSSNAGQIHRRCSRLDNNTWP